MEVLKFCHGCVHAGWPAVNTPAPSMRWKERRQPLRVRAAVQSDWRGVRAEPRGPSETIVAEMGMSREQTTDSMSYASLVHT